MSTVKVCDYITLNSANTVDINGTYTWTIPQSSYTDHTSQLCTVEVTHGACVGGTSSVKSQVYLYQNGGFNSFSSGGGAPVIGVAQNNASYSFEINPTMVLLTAPRPPQITIKCTDVDQSSIQQDSLKFSITLKYTYYESVMNFTKK